MHAKHANRYKLNDLSGFEIGIDAAAICFVCIRLHLR